MPNYDFRNKETGEVVEHTMSYTKLDQFLLDNPNLERYHSAQHLPVMSDGMRMDVPGIGRADSTFQKYVIDRIAETVPGNTIKKSHKSKTPREW